MSIESQLRETLYRAANTLDPTAPPPEVRVPGMRVLAQRRDRRRAAVLSAGFAVLIVAIGIPVGLSLVQSTETRVAAPIPQADIFGVPTRGSLAGDAGFVEGVRQRSWSQSADEPDPGTGASSNPDPLIETRRVVFAGDVAAGRWALVVGLNLVGLNTAQPAGEPADPDQTDRAALSDLAAVWFAGPPEATAEQMNVVGIPRGISSNLPISLYDGATGALVVVAAPADVIELSLRPDVAADATVTRNYHDTDASEGLVVTAVEPNLYFGKPAVQYRVTRAGVIVAEQSPEGYGTTVDAGIPYFTMYPDLELDYLRSPVDPSPGDPTLGQRMAAEILGEYGLRPDEVDLQVHYVGPVPGAAAAPATLTVLSATFPSGAILTRAAWRQQLLEPENPGGDPAFGEGVCAEELAAAGAPAAERVMALQCDVLSGGAESARKSTLVVLAPPTLAGGFAVVDSNSGAIRLALTDNGIAVAGFPVGARSVLIEAADGTVLDEVPISAP